MNSSLSRCLSDCLAYARRADGVSWSRMKGTITPAVCPALGITKGSETLVKFDHCSGLHFERDTQTTALSIIGPCCAQPNAINARANSITDNAKFVCEIPRYCGWLHRDATGSNLLKALVHPRAARRRGVSTRIARKSACWHEVSSSVLWQLRSNSSPGETPDLPTCTSPAAHVAHARPPTLDQGSRLPLQPTGSAACPFS